MSERVHTRRMILCGGLQSSGTTLVSWCFLQRQDMNGVLDMSNDVIMYSFDRVKEPIVWVKMTIGAFRWLDVCETYRDLGWNPEPLLVVRDVRAAFSSLMGKDYGFNGCTAEEPPLRMRSRRFLRDWELFRQNGWPILKFEDFIQDERTVLMGTCQALGLPWDENMICWRKNLYSIAYVKSNLNKTFAKSIDKAPTLTVAKLQGKAEVLIDRLPKTELDWLEKTFSAYNELHNYPKNMAPAAKSGPSITRAIPSYVGTKRQWYYDEFYRLRSDNERLYRETEKLHNEIEGFKQRDERVGS